MSESYSPLASKLATCTNALKRAVRFILGKRIFFLQRSNYRQGHAYSLFRCAVVGRECPCRLLPWPSNYRRGQPYNQFRNAFDKGCRTEVNKRRKVRKLREAPLPPKINVSLRPPQTHGIPRREGGMSLTS